MLCPLPLDPSFPPPHTSTSFAARTPVGRPPLQAKLLEHNVRFGDPECQSLMVRLRSDLLQSLQAQCRGEDVALEWSPDPSLTVVLAAKGYPGAYAKGGAIRGLEAVPAGAKVFHAGTATGPDGGVSATRRTGGSGPGPGLRGWRFFVDFRYRARCH